MTRRRIIITCAASAVAVFASAIGFRRGAVLSPIAGPRDDGLVGCPEAAVRGRFGPPTSESPGHYGLPQMAFVRQFTGPIKSAYFPGVGGGEYVSFEQRDGTWVAICNNWLPTGGAF